MKARLLTKAGRQEIRGDLFGVCLRSPRSASCSPPPPPPPSATKSVTLEATDGLGHGRGKDQCDCTWRRCRGGSGGPAPIVAARCAHVICPGVPVPERRGGRDGWVDVGGRWPVSDEARLCLSGSTSPHPRKGRLVGWVAERCRGQCRSRSQQRQGGSGSGQCTREIWAWTGMAREVKVLARHRSAWVCECCVYSTNRGPVTSTTVKAVNSGAAVLNCGVICSSSRRNG